MHRNAHITITEMYGFVKSWEINKNHLWPVK